MKAEASARLDQTSRRAIGRFVLKLAISMLAAQVFVTERSYLEALAAWLVFYAVFAAVSGFLVKEAVADRSFSFWDEATWLLLVASSLQMIGGWV